MIFANLFFLYAFLPLNLLLYYLTRNQAYRNVVLVAFSLFFYAWGEPVWVVLLLFSAAVDYFHGLFIERHQGQKIAKLGVVSSLVINLGLLVTFKYSGFLYENLNAWFDLGLTAPAFSLPIGISFYTFQTISYTVDVYRGDAKAQHSFGKFLLFVSSYHQLVAGPIVRYSYIADEIDNRRTTLADFYSGIGRFVTGLGKKVMIANVAGSFAAQYLDGDLAKLSVAGAWFGLLMFSLQIYFDFSGYSDMAIGLGRMFGFHYHENFNYPYISRSVTEFWRRWHISLGSFFRDYVYIPLGGNRRHQYWNLLLVWFLTGLWHGASWNFILWGLYFGLFIVLEKLFLKNLFDRMPGALSQVLSRIYFLFVAVLGWAIFYFTDLGRLQTFLGALFGAGGRAAMDPLLPITLSNNLFWIVIAVAGCLPVVPLLKKKLIGEGEDRGMALWATALQPVAYLLILFVCTAMLVGESYNPFLYFRF
ncbi:MAG: MBOAT family protein [Oscillospiraceae bacterium]|nr:MBOAT family protein [Oscillospiraceae bacterium]